MSDPAATITPEELARAILPKSDQLNADDLVSGPITVRILAVRSGNAEQPIAIAIEGRQPWYPCKSMTRVLTLAWGPNARDWLGRSVTLFRDPTVKWGGVAVGGIRISHMTHIEKPLSLALTETRGSRKPYRVDPLVVRTLAEVLGDVTPADLDRYRASESKPAVTAEDAPKIAAFLHTNPKALEKIRAWVAANPAPTATS